MKVLVGSSGLLRVCKTSRDLRKPLFEALVNITRAPEFHTYHHHYSKLPHKVSTEPDTQHQPGQDCHFGQRIEESLGLLPLNCIVKCIAGNK